MISKRKSQISVNSKTFFRGSMYTGNSINPTLNQITAKQPSHSMHRPVGFAIIPMRHDEKRQPDGTHHDTQSTNQSDIEHIINILQTTQNAHIIPENTAVASQKTTDNHHASVQSYADMVSDKTSLTLATALGGVVVGMLLNKGFNAKPQTPNIISKRELADNLVKAMPDLIQSVATGTAMIAGTVGLTRWLNQETPERLKARLEAMKE
jgi:hypothetical protein